MARPKKKPKDTFRRTCEEVGQLVGNRFFELLSRHPVSVPPVLDGATPTQIMAVALSQLTRVGDLYVALRMLVDASETEQDVGSVLRQMMPQVKEVLAAVESDFLGG